MDHKYVCLHYCIRRYEQENPDLAMEALAQ
jgi:hypothetical protein